MKFGYWVTPDYVDIKDIEEQTFDTMCFEFLRFYHKDPEKELYHRGSTIQEQGGPLGSGSVYVMHSNYFGGLCYTPENVERIKKAVKNRYVTLSGTLSTGVLEMLDDNELMEATLVETVAFVKDIGFTGIDLNIEGVGDFDQHPDMLEPYLEWVKSLGFALHNVGLKLRFVTIPDIYECDKPEVCSSCGYNEDEAPERMIAHGSTWKNSLLAPLVEERYIDQVVLMAYDYFASLGNCKVAPERLVKNSINMLNEDGIPLYKMVLGVANYGVAINKLNVWDAKVLYTKQDEERIDYPAWVYWESQEDINHIVNETAVRFGIQEFCMWRYQRNCLKFDTSEPDEDDYEQDPLSVPTEIIEDTAPVPSEQSGPIVLDDRFKTELLRLSRQMIDLLENINVLLLGCSATQ